MGEPARAMSFRHMNLAEDEARAEEIYASLDEPQQSMFFAELSRAVAGTGSESVGDVIEAWHRTMLVADNTDEPLGDLLKRTNGVVEDDQLESVKDLVARLRRS